MMLKDKIVKVFDVELLKNNPKVFCKYRSCFDSRDLNNGIWQEKFDGSIKYVSEHELFIEEENGDGHNITLDGVINGFWSVELTLT